MRGRRGAGEPGSRGIAASGRRGDGATGRRKKYALFLAATNIAGLRSANPAYPVDGCFSDAPMLQRRFAQALKRPSALLAVLLLLTAAAAAYPIDGHIVTGIRRLLRLSLIQDGVLKGTLPPPGGMAGMGDIQLNLSGARGDSLATLPPAHPALQKEIATLFPNRDESYGLALLDIRPGRAPRAAYHKADRQYNPGSVGKLAIAAGLIAFTSDHGGLRVISSYRTQPSAHTSAARL